MSENTIDIDIKFHLGDIQKLFEKAIEGADIDLFKELESAEGAMKGTLLHDIELTEDKTKLLEAFTNLKISAPMINEISKMIDEMHLEQDGQSEIVERTQNSMIALLTLSKTMLKMFEEKFPISADMQKDLDEMNDVLADSTRDIDDKIETLLRSVSNIFAPIKEQLPSAFRVTPTEETPSFLDIFDADRQRAVVDEVRSFVDEVEQLSDEFATIFEEQGRMRGKTRIPQLRGLTDQAKELKDKFNAISDRVYEIQNQTGTVENVERLTEGQPFGMIGSQTFEMMEKIMLDMLDIFTELSSKINEDITKVSDNFEKMAHSVAMLEAHLNNAVELLSDATIDVKESIKKVKEAVKSELLRIENVLGEDLYQGVIEDIWKQMIKTELVQPVHTTETAKRLDYILRLAESALSSLTIDLEKMMVGKSQEELEDIGLGNIHAFKMVLERTKERQKAEYKMKGAILPPRSEGIGDFDIDIMKGMIETISTSTTAKDALIMKVSDSLDTLNDAVELTNKIAEAQAETIAPFGDAIKKIGHNTNMAADRMNKSKNDIIGITSKLHEVIEKWDETFRDKEIGRLDET